MAKDVYEKHILQNPHLPFLFNTQYLGEKSIVYSHWHENIEIISCVDGEGTVFSDSLAIPLKKGETVVINSRHIHSVSCDKKLTYYFVIIDKQFFEENDIDMEKIYFSEKIYDENITRLMQKIGAAFNNDEQFAVAKQRNAISNLLVYMCQNYVTNKTNSQNIFSKSYNTVLLSLDYINENYSRKITLEEISKKLGYSKYHFARLFKETTGFTLVDHINATRCGVAKQMLMKTNKSVSEICLDCGFDSASYFSKTFKKFYGCLPTQYRKSYTAKD